MVIVATRSGNELRELLFKEYDIEVGDTENSFLMTCLRGEWEDIPADARIYIPDTEYGGIFRKLETNTAQDTISAGGLTWRGMLQKKVISPEEGEDYATDSGELNAIIKSRVESALPRLFFGTDISTGVTVDYQYPRYCTLYEGLRGLLASVGYRLEIAYSQLQNGVVVQAVPIENYAGTIEFSENNQLNYTMQAQSDGVNHLICLGSGELRDRLVYHLYVDASGKIVTTQYYTGIDEVAEVYDSPGAEMTDLINGGKNRLKEVMNKNLFEIRIHTDEDLPIGDIVGGRDYLSGMAMQAPIIGKIIKWQNGFQTIEYRLDEAGEVTE